MKRYLHISRCSRHGNFIIRFHNSVTSVTAHQMPHLIQTLDEVSEGVVELGWIQAFESYPINCCSKPRFKLCLGRIILVLSQQDLVDIMTQLWEICPTLMKYTTEECTHEAH